MAEPRNPSRRPKHPSHRHARRAPVAAHVFCLALTLAALAVTPAAARADATNYLDSTFGDNGLSLQAAVPGKNVAAQIPDVAMTAGNKIVIAGTIFMKDLRDVQRERGDIALIRVNPDGSRDPGFGDDGAKIASFRYHGHRTSLEVTRETVAPDGKILVTGYANLNYAPRTRTAPGLFVARFRPDGQLDTSFGDGGFVVARPTADHSDVDEVDVATWPNGAVVLAATVGHFTGPLTDQGSDIYLTRFTDDGARDHRFGDHGRMLLNLARYGYNDDELPDRGLAAEAGGKLVVGDTIVTRRGSSVALTRIDRRGRTDKSFAGGGRRVYRFAAGDFHGQHLVSMRRVGDKLFMVAEGSGSGVRSGEYRVLVARLNLDGSPDTSFAGSGLLVAPLINGAGDFSDARPGDIAARADGSAVVTGDATMGADFVARFTPDGRLDTSFADSGLWLAFSGNTPYPEWWALAVDENGRIVAIGWAPQNVVGTYEVAAFLP